MNTYNVQIMTFDYNLEEFEVEAKHAEGAKACALEALSIHPSKVAMCAVFKEGSTISEPVNDMRVNGWPTWYGEWHKENQDVIDEFFSGGLIMWHKDWRHRVYLTKTDDMRVDVWPTWYGEWHKENQDVIEELWALEGMESKLRDMERWLEGVMDYGTSMEIDAALDETGSWYSDCAEAYSSTMNEVAQMCNRLLDYAR